VIHDATVRFHFREPEPGLRQAASSINAGLLANASLEMTEEGFAPGSARKVIGSGPFVITGEERNRELTLSAREDYNCAPPVFAERGMTSGRPVMDTVSVGVATEDRSRVGVLTA